jgi:hypothetical protein
MLGNFVKDNMKYIGLDISSSVIGWNYFEIKNKNILNNSIKCGYIKPPKLQEIESLIELKKIILDQFKPYKRKKDLEISIEEFPFFISKGKGNFNSTARTITKLAIYNRFVSSVFYEMFNTEPTFYKVATIRASIKKLVNEKDVKKQDMPRCVEKVILDRCNKKWEFPYVINSKNKIAKESEDIADSFGVSITHAYKIGEIE